MDNIVTRCPPHCITHYHGATRSIVSNNIVANCKYGIHNRRDGAISRMIHDQIQHCGSTTAGGCTIPDRRAAQRLQQQHRLQQLTANLEPVLRRHAVRYHHVDRRPIQRALRELHRGT